MTGPPASLSAGPCRLDSVLAGSDAEDPYAARHGQPTAIAYTEELGEGRTYSISPEVEAVLGYTQAEWMADPMIWVKLLHLEDRERVVEVCRAANEALEPFRAEYRMIARDGRVIHICDEAVVVYGSQGQPLCWQGVMVVRR